MRCIHTADSSGHTAVLAQCIAQQKTGHAEFHPAFRFMILYQVIMNLDKSFLPIIIICIDDHKGLLHKFLTAQNRLAGPPWLCPSLRLCKSCRQIVHLLKGVNGLDALLHPVPDHFPEILLQILPDDEYDLVKTCLHGIMNGIVNDDLPGRSDRLQLFDSPSKTAANSCCHDDQCCLFHISLLCIYFL